jgi:peroxiredoxin
LYSFSAPEYAKMWVEESCPSFTLLLDPERVTYRAYSVEHSWLRSWNLRTFWRYIQLLRIGRKWRGIQGDSAQLGGDFIIDRDGIVRMAYRSYDPTDRPSY